MAGLVAAEINSGWMKDDFLFFDIGSVAVLTNTFEVSVLESV